MDALAALCAADADPWALVDALQSLLPPEQKGQDPVAPSADSIQEFLEWADAPQHLRIAPSKIQGAGLSVYTKKSIAKDELILSVGYFRTISLVNTEEEFREMVEADPIMSGSQSLQLGLSLLVLEDIVDFWRPYYAILPQTFPSLPWTMNRSQLEMFKGIPYRSY